ncbi:MAG: Na/Pi cotransporter family protein [Clostridiales bacterium]|jgi:phosphate:Na+ symporter|nr:Na/Pi cotransporter family protein [Clostridiales bacterium]
MSGFTIANNLLMFLAGLGVFLYAMKVLSNSLEALAGRNLKNMLQRMTKNKIAGVGVGMGVTVLIQSSSATTVMVIGFVNVGMLTLTQAATVIYGANIGTTITAQLVAVGLLGGDTLSVSLLIAALVGVASLITLFTEKENIKRVAGILIGVGLIFVGLQWMSDSMSAFAHSDGLVSFLSSPLLKNKILLVLIGVAITAVIQSSSAFTGIIIAMMAAGLLNINQGIYLTFGSNIGTCVTAILACLGSGTNAKRAALIHLIFNVTGTVVFMLIGLGLDYGALMERIFRGMAGTQLAMMHTIFNVTTVLFVLPFTSLLVKLTERIISEKKSGKDNAPHTVFLESHLLNTPPAAIGQLKKEVAGMAAVALENFNRAIDGVMSGKPDDSKSLIMQGEAQLNFLNKEIPKFLVKLSALPLEQHDAVYVSTVYHSVSDLERIGDYAKNLLEYSETMAQDNLSFSAEAQEEMSELKAKINSVYAEVTKIVADSDISRIETAYAYEQEVDDMKEKMIRNHIKRLEDGSCSAETGALYYAIASDCERISDHLINIANAVRSYAKLPRKKVVREGNPA